jgi:CrcB protein
VNAVPLQTGLVAVAAIALGGALGSLLRWWIGVRLNAMHQALPLGTLLVNVAGGWLVGLAIGWFAARPDLPEAWRLLAITGFLGGLTTFSTFSAEAAALLLQGRLGAVVLHVGAHTAGSLAATLVGLWMAMGWFGRP